MKHELYNGSIIQYEDKNFIITEKKDITLFVSFSFCFSHFSLNSIFLRNIILFYIINIKKKIY